MADMADLCHICNGVASRTCKMCGRPTCEQHLKDGVCSSCASGRKAMKAPGDGKHKKA